MGPFRPLFVYFRYFLTTISIIQIEKSLDGVLGIRTRGHRMVGADETTERILELTAQTHANYAGLNEPFEVVKETQLKRHQQTPV